MSTIQKRKVALDFLLDGKDRLTNQMQNNYSKYYGDFLFTEKNVLKNLRDANILAGKADKVISYVANIDKKNHPNIQSTYTQYFSGQGSTAPISPKKKTNQSDIFLSDINQNIHTQNSKTQKLKTQNSSSPNHQQPDTSPSNISNNKLNLQISDLYDSQIMNQALLRDDNLFIDSVQQNNLQSMKIHDALKIKQLKEKERIYQNSNSFGTFGIGNQRSNSVNGFVPYGKERNTQGFIIEPITQYGIEQNALIKKKLSSIPIEKQRISMVVPPSSDKVLVIKRGLHFFDKGISLKSKGDNKSLDIKYFKKNINSDKVLPKTDDSQTNPQQQKEQQKYYEMMSNNLYMNRMINTNTTTNIKQAHLNETIVQNSNSQILQNSINDQKHILRNDKILYKSELNSSNYLESDTTTLQNSNQARNNSQESILPLIDQNKNISNNKYHIHQQVGKYYFPSGIIQSSKHVNSYNYKQNTSEGRPTSSTQINQASTVLELSKNENSRLILTEQETDSLIHNDPAQLSLCGNPECKNNLEGILSKTSDIKEESSSSKQSKKFRKNSSMNQVQNISQTYTQQLNSQGHLQSKTMNFDNTYNNIDQKQKETALKEKSDEISQQLESQYYNPLENPDQFQYMDVNMKQNDGGKITDIQIGKFVLITEQNGQQEEDLDIKQNDELKQGSLSPQKKVLFNNNVHFNWKMNALDEAQLIELMKKEKDSKIKLPKIFIYNKKKYTTDQYPAPGDYDPNYSCIEKHSHQVNFSKAKLSKTSTTQQIKQNNISLSQQTPIIPKSKIIQKQKNTLAKEEGYEIMFSELMKDIKKEVKLQKIQNKDLQHPMNGLTLEAIPHSNITDLNKNFNQQITYCKKCLHSLKYYLVQDHPTITKKQAQKIIISIFKQLLNLIKHILIFYLMLSY